MWAKVNEVNVTGTFQKNKHGPKAILEDPVAGIYSLTCQAQAYEFPTPVAVTLANEEPVQLDFALSAVPTN